MYGKSQEKGMKLPVLLNKFLYFWNLSPFLIKSQVYHEFKIHFFYEL